MGVIGVGVNEGRMRGAGEWPMGMNVGAGVWGNGCVVYLLHPTHVLATE